MEDAVGAGEDLVEAATARSGVAGHAQEVVLDQGEASRDARPCDVAFLEVPRVVVLEGVDADDLVAGLYGNLALRAVAWLLPGLWSRLA